MRKILFVVTIIAITNMAGAQNNADVGIWSGTATYFGDMSQINLGRSLGFNYGAFVRYNFNPRVAARFQVMNGTIAAVGQFDKIDTTFNKNVFNLSLMAEINFFKYSIGRKEMPFTTYLLGGVGLGSYNDVTNNIIIAMQIPIGFGAKFNLGKKVGVGIELIMNKYFDDNIDNLNDPRGNAIIGSYNDFWHNNDYTVYMGVHLTYKINLSKKACPVYEYE